VGPFGPFFHGPIKKGAADELLLADGGDANTGKFLIRSKGASTDEFIVSVVFKGAGTHHQLVRTGDGTEFTINKGPCGGATTIEAACKFLETKTKKWPLALTDGVPNAAAVEVAASGGGAMAARVAPAPATHAAPASSGEDNYGDNTEFLWEGLKKDAADELLLADGGDSVSGKFLIRRKGTSANEFILSVVFKGKPSHHQLVRVDEGEVFTLNKMPTGATVLAKVVKWLRVKQAKWPVKLTEGCVNPDAPKVAAAVVPSPPAATAPHQTTPWEPPAPAVVEAPPEPPARANAAPNARQASVTALTTNINSEVGAAKAAMDALEIDYNAAVSNMENVKSQGSGLAIPKEVDPMNPHYLWGDLSREECEAKLSGQQDGTFIIRTRDGVHNYILAMIFRGKPSHHMLAQGESGNFEVNKKAMGGLPTLSGCIDHMRQPLDTWPIALKHGIPNPDRPKPTRPQGDMMSSMASLRHGARFRQKFTLEDAIGSHAVAPLLDALTCV
jgi:hypothetical protein